MKIKEKMNAAFNTQINSEMWSANLYLSMSNFLRHEGYDGMAHWMHAQSKEEMTHAYDMMDFVNRRGGVVEIQPIEAVPQKWESVMAVFEAVYKHECTISKSIEELLKLAKKEDDLASEDFCWKYIREQVEEEDTASGIIDRLRLSKDKSLLVFDQELAHRN